jgi:uridine kinase
MKPYIIGITGGSGSGKTSFINSLRNKFTEEKLCIQSLDNYYKPREHQETDEKGIRNFDLPSSIDERLFIADLQKLMRGEIVQRKEYTFNNELKEPRQLKMIPAPVIVVEGLFVFHFPEIRQMMDLKVYLTAKENLKVIRRITRDRVERNYPLDDVLYRYQYHVLPTYEKYIKPYMDEADIIINNNDHFNNALEVVAGFIHTLLHSSNREKGNG